MYLRSSYLGHSKAKEQNRQKIHYLRKKTPTLCGIFKAVSNSVLLQPTSMSAGGFAPQLSHPPLSQEVCLQQADSREPDRRGIVMYQKRR